MSSSIAEKIIYNDGDLLLSGDIVNFREGVLHELDHIIILVCDDGVASLKIDGRQFILSRGGIAICPPGSRIEDFKENRNCSIKLLGIKFSTVLNTIYRARRVWTVMTYAKTRPVYHLSESDFALTMAYYNVIRRKLQTEKGFYYDEILQNLFKCAFYEISVIISRQMTSPAEDGELSRKQVIFKQFSDLLASSGGRMRTVEQFAEKLCITPKYLSASVKAVSGYSALELILNNSMEVIKHELAFTDKSIKEISDDFDFPSISAFGKFIRSRVGVSPREYRKTL